MLAGQGFREVYNLNGGIRAWEGGVAEGPVEMHLDLLPDNATPLAIIKLAYAMESSLADFYRAVIQRTIDSELVKLMGLLASVEDKHKEYLIELYESFGDKPSQVFEDDIASGVMEGGLGRDTFMTENEPFLKSVLDMIDLAMIIETQALDLYLRFVGRTENHGSRQILYRIADEEKAHLKALGHLRDEKTSL